MSRSTSYERLRHHPARRDFLLFTFLIIAALFNARQAKAQSAIELENVNASYVFGEQITFVATVKSSVSIQSVSIMISDESQNLTRAESLKLPADGYIEYRLDMQQTPLRPFADVKWNYQFTLPDGSTIQSEPFFLHYTDNRFNWQSLESGLLRINWYQGDASFGQAALAAAQAGLESIKGLMPLDSVEPIEVFIYVNTDDLRGTLALDSKAWVAGHADPALGVAMVAIEPGAEQNIAMEQRIPHEIMHVILYRSVGEGYNNVPVWLREGTATLAETYPNADYDRVLAEAVASDQLMPFSNLCNSFPENAGQAFLAYAESRSFTKYLHDRYGSTGLSSLAASYADGVDCEHGTERAFGVSLSSLETEWRSSALGQNAFISSLQNISPYLVLLCLVLVIPLIGIAGALRKRGNSNESGTSSRK